MKFLRTASTGRLLAVVAGVVLAIAAGTAIAVAAGSSGPVPKRESLAQAVRGALKAKPVQGISARVTFTNNLIGASSFQGGPTDPLLQGASGRLWLSNDHRLRLELQTDNGDAQVLVNKGSFWISDPAQNVVYKGSLPSGGSGKTPAAKHANDAADNGIPTIAAIQGYINKLIKHANVSGAIPGDIAGQPSYTVRVSPRHDGGLLGSVQTAWDAIRGVPLRIAIYARNSSSPVLQLKVSDISYGPVASSVFRISPPAGSHVVQISSPAHNPTQPAVGAKLARARQGRHTDVHGIAAVAKHVPFTLSAPRSLVGLPRQSAQLLNMGGKSAALITYGQGLGGIAVIEQPQTPGTKSQSSILGGGQSSLSLPTVSIDGSTGQELDTPLGTVVTFSRGGVSYTVLGSVPPAAADLAARAL
jgi:outer membrane lipoprotein-sorting protein